MRKFWTILSVMAIVIALGFVSGCVQDNNPVTAPNGGGSGGTVNSVELRLQYDLVRGFKGEQREMTIIAIAKNAAGV